MNTDNFHAISHRPVSDLLLASLTESADLEQRIHFAQQTIRNTLVKLGHLRRPDHLTWAFTNARAYRIIGITTGPLTGDYRDRHTDITAKIRGGEREPHPYHALHIAILYHNGSIGQAFLPLHLLGNDPIHIAQYTRGALYANEAAERVLDRRILAREREQLVRSHAAQERAHEKNLAQLDAKITIAHRPVGPKARKPRQAPVAVG